MIQSFVDVPVLEARDSNSESLYIYNELPFYSPRLTQ